MKWVSRIEEAFVGFVLMAVTAVLFLNVVLRYGFSANTTWAEELIRYGMIWITFIGSAICFRKSLHVGIDFFVDFLSKKWGAVVGLFVKMASAVFVSFLLYYGLKLVQFSFTTGQITPSLQIGVYWVYLAIPIGAGLSLIHLLVLIYQTIKEMRTNLEEEKQS